MSLWRRPGGDIFSRLRAVPWLKTMGQSTDRGWTGLSCASVSGECLEPLRWQFEDMLMSFVLAGEAKVEWKQDQVTHNQQLSAGSICRFAGHEQHEVRWSGQIAVLSCACSAAFLRHIGQLQCDCRHDSYLITTEIGFRDSELWQFAQLANSKLTSSGPPNHSLQELLNFVLGDYLLRSSTTCRDCSVCSRAHRSSPGLHTQRIFPALHNSIKFIDANLADADLSIERISEEVDLSPYYFARMFRAALGISPYRYVIERRLQLAQRLLAGSSSLLTDVALNCGFSSQSHFTSTFRRHFGVAPLKYRHAVLDQATKRHGLRSTPD